MHDCDFCPRTVCDKCVPLPCDIPSDAFFKCLYCFSYSNGQQGKAGPYTVPSLCFSILHDILIVGTRIGPFLFGRSH
jgi:hypothetical protein